LKQHKPWLDEECSKLLTQEKQVKFEWLQNPSQMNEDNMNSARCESSKTFRYQKGQTFEIQNLA
jgi:hypothetical protein